MEKQIEAFIQSNKIINKNYHMSKANTHYAGIDVRDSMLVLPNIFQPFLTWLTAKPASNEQYKDRGLYYQIITAFLSVIIGTSMSIYLLSNTGYLILLLPFSLIVTTSGFRKLQVMIFHNCVHGLIFKKMYKNKLLGEFISILMLLKNFTSYKKEHLAHHSSKKLLTFEDDTIQYLFNFIGLSPGMKKKQLWMTVFFSFASPFCYLRGIFGRITVCLFSHSPIHNIAAISYWCFLFFIINYFNIWKFFIIAWLLPLFFLYQISATLRLIVEHTWPNEESMSARDKEFICLSTSAVFLGEAIPNNKGSFIKQLAIWSWWGFKMIAVHLFSRVFVLVGDTPCHDFHHRRPSTRRWYNYSSERQADEKNGCPGYPLNYSETWGLFSAINNNFERLSKMSTR